MVTLVSVEIETLHVFIYLEKDPTSLTKKFECALANPNILLECLPHEIFQQRK